MKLSYAQLTLIVNQLYDFSISDPEKVLKQCDLIAQTIEACGWDVYEYIRVMVFGEHN